jgi:glycosyltransferase involved in cell wall biosynthesis
MKVCIFHYHLNPGGVTRIIGSQIEALSQLGGHEICLVTGLCENKHWYEKQNVSVIEDNHFNYLTDNPDLGLAYEHVTKKLRNICTKQDILHFHNLNLGKNPLVTLAVSNMASEGYKILNHAHDFAEDRPDNMRFVQAVVHKFSNKPLDDIFYPKVNNYHMATLNGHDLERCRKYGMDISRSHLLPNPVVFNERDKDGDRESYRNEIISALKLDKTKLIITYPVRVIRRKNIAEFILLATLFAPEANWIVTQPPKNPVEAEHYNRWKEFCKKEQIKIHWEAGNKVDFEKLIRASDFCVSTSIQEGFGMVYMEPWLLNTPVAGRNIKMVTDDLKAAGIEFTMLYDTFSVRGEKEMHELNFDEQQLVIKECLKDPERKKQLIRQNAFLSKLLDLPSEQLVKRNKEVILTEFSLDKYRNRLDELYQRLT